MNRSPHDHPVFSRFYAALSALGEHTDLAESRSKVLAPASGRLLVVGLGPGHDLDHLPPAVTAVIGVEPSGPMRDLAAHRVDATRARGVEVEVVDAVAEELPLPDDSVDAVLFALVLCSVTSVPRALAEARRVLRPDGVVLVLEHVRAAERTWTRRLQRAVGPAWPHLAGGCRVDRDTRADLVRAGFDDSGLRDAFVPGIPVVAPHLVGAARLVSSR